MDNNENKYIEKISITEFRESGALWFINQILHLFGLALVYDVDKDILYPAKTKFRGFAEKSNDLGYKKLTKYLENNIEYIKSGIEDISD